MLVVIVPVRKHVKHMDVYLKLVIDELQLLWEGIQMYDIDRPISQRSFKYYGILCWTIHDHPRLFVCVSMHIYNSFNMCIFDFL